MIGKVSLPPKNPYSPKGVEWWLKNWDLLDALVECPATAEHHLTSYHERYASHLEPDTACPEPRQGRGPGLSWAEMRADFRTALEDLFKEDPTHDVYKIVVGVAVKGYSYDHATQWLHKSKTTVVEQYYEGMHFLALRLGWLTQDEPKATEHRDDPYEVPEEETCDPETSAAGAGG